MWPLARSCYKSLEKLSINNSFSPQFVSVLIAASFGVCYALLSLTTDALGMLALQRRSRELLLPWLIWYILDMGKSSTFSKIHSKFLRTPCTQTEIRN